MAVQTGRRKGEGINRMFAAPSLVTQDSSYRVVWCGMQRPRAALPLPLQPGTASKLD